VFSVTQREVRLNKILLSVSLLAAGSVLHAENANERLKEATEVVRELMGAGDSGIPQEFLQNAHCAVVIPGAKKGGFFIGAQYGRGFAICREKDARRGWGAPAAVRMEGGTIGAQIGGAETDIFMLVMNEEGMKKLLDSKFTLDASAGVAAGPLGRSASAKTDGHLTAGILSWSRSRGAFAGATVGGGSLRNDLDENEELYGKRLTNREILTGAVKAPASAQGLIAALNNFGREGTRAREVK
jgi:SH3 domain-containing YSC84-like protein 1